MKPMTKEQLRKIDMEIGKRLREARHACDLTQEGLADQLGITFQQVQKYENGTNRISGSRMAQIGAALKTDPAFLVRGL